ncbi:MAG: polysaccharide deacetylase family protein [Bacteroidetes bacterium]|nr:polysaccharide deacetylase family protein [Bacteroidota bacterium]
MTTKLKVPVLVYHHVLPANAKVDESILNSPFTISDSEFYKQMLFLSQSGYKAIHLNQLLTATKEKPQTKFDHNKPIVITFDDGWIDNYEYAVPILKSFNFSATFFVITSYVDSAGCMSVAQLLEIQQAGMKIESHAHTHTPLELLSNSEMQWELTHSKNLLEEHLEKNVAFISFPHGSYNKKVLEAAKNAGYLGCGTSNFGYATSSSKNYQLPRILIRKNCHISEFAKISEGSKWTFIKGKLIQNSKNLIKNTIGIERYQNLYSVRNRLKRAGQFD